MVKPMKRLKELADDQLVVLYADGCNEAFNILLERYDAAVHTYIRFNVSDPDLAEDIFQDTFIKVITTIKKGKYAAQGKFKAWVIRIAHNLIMDNYRKQSIQKIADDPLFLNGTDEWVEYMPSEDLNQEEVMLKKDKLAELYRNLKTLPVEQRQVVFLRYWQDMSFKQIAETTGVSINTALGRMRYALINLRRQAQQ
ncbi:RNA polymerase sigma factor sigX [Porphyromonas macacae]|uniref:RNA polymerase sigma factor sigX n=2 Tax=Porphyromonas macacae TaxID=28115 RepID=A0A379DKD9_9PORP|nr:RNA polymerase sigma factor sigX [Porphyromonas macacae]